MMIKSIINRFNTTYYSLSIGALLLLSTKTAHAQNVGTVMETVTTNTGAIPTLFTSLSYVTGVGFTILGLIKMRDYVDNPSQNHMKDALARLGIGAALILLPFAIQVAAGTVGADAGATVTRPALYN